MLQRVKIAEFFHKEPEKFMPRFDLRKPRNLDEEDPDLQERDEDLYTDMETPRFPDVKDRRRNRHEFD